MRRWFEKTKLRTDYNYVSSRIRLVRNLDEHVFPSKLDETESKVLTEIMMKELANIGEVEERDCETSMISQSSDIHRMALKERRVLNSVIAAKKTATGLILSKEEDISLVLNGDDHIRLQLLSEGMHLEDLWKRADKLDDYINERFRYAFDEQYGYLTSYPTNIGTGMRANIVLHLPSLSLGKNFQNLLTGMSRFGVTIKGVYGEGRENYGALYDISNPKTLGQSEKEIIDQISRVAMQLNAQEANVRKLALQEHRLEKEDEAYKSFGILKYARKLSLKDALIYLSALLQGVSDGIIELKDPQAVYGLMFGVQPYNLLKLSERPLGKNEMEIARAGYIRQRLAEIAD